MKQQTSKQQSQAGIEEGPECPLSVNGSRRTTTRFSVYPETATEKELTRAYRKLAKQYHPDTNPGAEEQLQGHNGRVRRRRRPREAQGVRRGQEARPDGAGDARRVRRRFAAPVAERPSASTTSATSATCSVAWVTSAGRDARGMHTGPKRGEDVHARLHLSFEDAIRGVTTAVHVEGEARCETCHGSGAAPGSFTCHLHAMRRERCPRRATRACSA